MEVIDAIAQVQTDRYDRPVVPVVILKAVLEEQEEAVKAATDSTAVADTTSKAE